MMLLDTHVLIWAATGDRKLSKSVKRVLADPECRIFVSVVSRWEIVLKQRKPDFYLPVPFEEVMNKSSYEPLDLPFETPRLVEQLPNIHSDPFDRILAAQSLLMGLTLVTRDRRLRRYPVPTFW